MPGTIRVRYSLNSEVVARFNAIYRDADRNHMIEELMMRALNRHFSEDEVVAAAWLVETHPAFAECRKVSEWVDAQACDTLARF